MVYTEMLLKGAYIIDIEQLEDDRGWFGRTFCQEEFAALGLCSDFVQHNSSYSRHRGTVRGMHYQLPPYSEVKIVRCVRGAIYDVIVDIRDDSETYMQWFGVELSENDNRMLYVPKGFAHGFQTLSDDTEVFYLMSEFYRKGFDAGLRWNDKRLGITWPITEGIIISEKDASL